MITLSCRIYLPMSFAEFCEKNSVFWHCIIICPLGIRNSYFLLLEFTKFTNLELPFYPQEISKIQNAETLYRNINFVNSIQEIRFWILQIRSTEIQKTRTGPKCNLTWDVLTVVKPWELLSCGISMSAFHIRHQIWSFTTHIQVKADPKPKAGQIEFPLIGSGHES